MFQAVIGFFEDFGTVGMFIHSFIDAIIFPIPAFFLQVSLSVLDPKNAIWLATIGYIACLLGTPVGYWMGKIVGETILNKFVKQEWIHSAEVLFHENGEAAILIGSFTPIPFKVFTILAGFFKFSVWKLIVYAALGRAVKFYAVGFTFHFFGKSSENFIRTYLSIIMGVIAGILCVVYYMKKRMERRKK